MFRLIAFTLAATLCLPAGEVAKLDLRALALQLPNGLPVRVRTLDKKVVEGRLGAVAAEGVMLQVIERGQISERSVPFAQMKSIKPIDKSMPLFLAVIRLPLDLILAICFPMQWP